MNSEGSILWWWSFSCNSKKKRKERKVIFWLANGEITFPFSFLSYLAKVRVIICVSDIFNEQRNVSRCRMVELPTHNKLHLLNLFAFRHVSSIILIVISYMEPSSFTAMQLPTNNAHLLAIFLFAYLYICIQFISVQNSLHSVPLSSFAVFLFRVVQQVRSVCSMKLYATKAKLW